jgi:hypothetical protein
MMERIARVDTISDDGSFAMTLATEAEASDGHILSIRGGQVPDKMPLLVSHWNDPSGTAGSITHATKDLDSSPPRLRAIGQIELGGEGPSAEIRRDLAHMVKQGHIGAVSVRWDEIVGKSTRRVNLPGDHPHFVDGEKETDARKKYGLYFEEWRAMEGSIVAIGADPKALIGRAIETEGDVRTFWREMAGDVNPAENDTEARLHLFEAELSMETAPLTQLRRLAEECREAGYEQADLFNAVHGDECTADQFEAVNLGGRSFLLPRDVVAQIGRPETVDETPETVAPETVSVPEEIPAREQPRPNNIYSPAVVAEYLKEGLREARAKLASDTRAALDEVRGRIRK